MAEALSTNRVLLKKGNLQKSSGGRHRSFHFNYRIFEFEAVAAPNGLIANSFHLTYYDGRTKKGEISLDGLTEKSIHVLNRDDPEREKHGRVMKYMPHLFTIESMTDKRKPRMYYLAAESKEEMIEWVAKLKEGLSRGKQYAVKTDKKEGTYLAQFNSNLLALTEVANDAIAISWPLKDIKQFSLYKTEIWFKHAANPLGLAGRGTVKQINNVYLTVDEAWTGPRLCERMKKELEVILRKPLIERET
ncbi:uncharacterized protein [Oscarella lobularis]|uniref:uncharacterized protein n=1 Tax=Oscarella lobularis TaxID=121494 RepID=UPI003313DA0B